MDADMKADEEDAEKPPKKQQEQQKQQEHRGGDMDFDDEDEGPDKQQAQDPEEKDRQKEEEEEEKEYDEDDECVVCGVTPPDGAAGFEYQCEQCCGMVCTAKCMGLTSLSSVRGECHNCFDYKCRGDLCPAELDRSKVYLTDCSPIPFCNTCQLNFKA
jgi:hypothetical protein